MNKESMQFWLDSDYAQKLTDIKDKDYKFLKTKSDVLRMIVMEWIDKKESQDEDK